MKKIKIKLDCDVSVLDSSFDRWLSSCINDFMDDVSVHCGEAFFTSYVDSQNPWIVHLAWVDEND